MNARNPLVRYFDALRGRVQRRELHVMLLIAAAAGGVWLFLAIADAVIEGHGRELDLAIIMAMRNPADLGEPIGPRWVEELARDVTALGAIGNLTLLALAVAGYLSLVQKRRVAVFLLIAVAGGFLTSTAFKLAYDRPRPDVVSRHAYVYTASFPSGHSMHAAVTYFTLAALLARVHRQRRVKVYVFGFAALLTFAVGLTRIYMGVHWPTDVLAGWAAGVTWAILCWLAALWLQQRRVIEGEGAAAAGGTA